MTTHFHDFVSERGFPVTVEYSASGGEPNHDHPGHVCDGGGSGPEVVIFDCWPNDAAYNDLARRRNDRAWRKAPTCWDRLMRWLIEVRMTQSRFRRARLSIEEMDRVAAHIAETYEPEDYEPDFRW